jgi:hypothetical protein
MAWARAWAVAALVFSCCALAGSGSASADDPLLKPGRDPGGVAVAVLADGFDYRQPDIAEVLARDGEGVAIAWDSVDRDALPFLAEGKGASAARALAARGGGVRVIAIRVDARDPASVGQGIAFAVSTPAKIVVFDLPDDALAAVAVLDAAARKFPDFLFVVSPERTASGPHAEDPPNLVRVARGASAVAAAGAVSNVLGCGRGDLVGGDGAQRAAEFRERFARRSAARDAPCDPKRGSESGQQPQQ